MHVPSSLAPVGRGAAVAAIGPLRFDGFLAWTVWVFVHLLYLIEFSNRFLVLTRWTWDFFRHERGSRLITGTPLLPGLRGPEARARAAEGDDSGVTPERKSSGERLPGTAASAEERRRGVSTRRFGTVAWQRTRDRRPDNRADEPEPARIGGKERRR